MTISDDPVHLQLYARAPAPCRDYYGLTISEKHVILNIWNISHGPHIYPRRRKCLLTEFSEDKHLQTEVNILFGTHVLEFALHLADKQCNIQYLPTKVFLRVVRHLAASDILHLSQSSKIFFEICNTEAVWKIICRKRLKRRLVFDDSAKAEDVGWKEYLKSKIYKKSTLGSKAAVAKKDLNNADKRNMNNKNKPINNRNIVNTKKPQIDMIRNVNTKMKSATQVKLTNEMDTKFDVKKNQSTVNLRMNVPEKTLKVPINRSQLTQHNATLKCNEPGIAIKEHLSKVLQNNSNKKVVNRNTNVNNLVVNKNSIANNSVVNRNSTVNNSVVKRNSAVNNSVINRNSTVNNSVINRSSSANNPVVNRNSNVNHLSKAKTKK